MNKQPVVFSLFGNHYFASAMQKELGYEYGDLTLHTFPDEETSVKINSNVQDRHVIIIASLERPDSKLLPLLFVVETLRELGAKKIDLVAPYLPYMRQDKRFQAGESITSLYFAHLLSHYFDGLLTIDPHLHRWHALSELYTISTRVLHADDTIALWLKKHIKDPVLIGPDAESSQWVSEIAKKINAPYFILEKIRKSDHLIEASIPAIEPYKNHTPILIDDIISTAVTMIETVHHLKMLSMKPPICIGIHAIFSDNAFDDLLKAGAGKIITCNTITHPSNAIDMKDSLLNSMDFFENG